MIQDLWKPKEQRNLAPLSVPGASSAGSIRVVSGSGFRYVVPFPYRLHEMLSNVDSEHDSSIVSWLPDGKLFKVHDPRRFVECVIPSAFKQKSLKSFQRQLHLYGFQRVHDGVDKGSYYHEKFLRDDRDLCLSITRTKAPKRSRVTPTIRKDASFSQKLLAFQSRKNNTQADVTNNFSSSVVPSTKMSAIAISPTIFDDVSTNMHSSFIPENNVSMKGPLHQNTLSIISIDGASLSEPEHESSSSNFSHDKTHNASFPQQPKAQQQPLEGSIADTCRWLINAGVPVSAFDPVAISDISHSTFAVPQLVSSTSPIPPLNPRQSTITEKGSEIFCLHKENISLQKTETEPLQFNNEIATNGDMNSILAAVPPTNNLDPPPSLFQDGVDPFDNDQLLTCLLPGENLPLVDDSLWAL